VKGPALLITFECADASDADALADLRVEAMRESLERVGRFDVQRARDRLLNNFSPEYTQTIVVGGERVGFFVLRHEPEALFLEHLYVLPSHQKLGIGASVLRRVIDEADAAGLDTRLFALRGSESNRFYIRHGFILVAQDEFDNYYVRSPNAPDKAPVLVAARPPA
jgi:GNAT superfamily N-acetyltransferase